MAGKRSFFVIGDSISIQYGAHLGDMPRHVFEHAAAREPGRVVSDSSSPVGAYAGDSNGLLEYLRGHRAEIAAYDILLFNSGLHDIKTDPAAQRVQVPIRDYEGNLSSAVGLMREMKVSPVWVTTTPVPDERHNAAIQQFRRYDRDVVAYNNAAGRVMGKAGVPVIDLYAFTNRLGGDVYHDHVHFKDEVRRLQAAFIAGWLCGLRQ